MASGAGDLPYLASLAGALLRVSAHPGNGQG